MITRIISLIFILSLTVAPVYAGGISDAKAAANSIDIQFRNQYGSSSNLKQHIIKPSMGSNDFTTLNGQTSFNAHLECPSSTSFLQILIQQTSTGDFTAVISQDPQLSGHYTVQTTTPTISGICTNGFISCSQGTWSNCRYYEWAVGDDGTVNYSEVSSATPLGSCFCNNAHCNGSPMSQFNEVVNVFAANLAQLVASVKHFAITNAQASFPMITYWGENSQKCSMVANTNYSGSGYDNPASYYKNDANLTNAEQTITVSEAGNEYSPYYSVLHNEYIDNTTHSTKSCEIKRQVGEGNAVWVTDTGHSWATDCVSVNKIGNNLYQCYLPSSSDGCGDGCGVHFNYNVYGTYYIHLYSPDDFHGEVSVNGNSVYSYNEGVTSGDNDAVTYNHTGTANGSFYACVSNVGGCNGNPSGSMYVLLKRHAEVNETKNDTCQNLNTDNCQLKDEQICDYNGGNCVYIIKDYQRRTVNLLPQCRILNDSQTALQWAVCVNGSSLTYKTNALPSSGTLETGQNIWWDVKKIYTCDAKKITVNADREQAVESTMDYNNGVGTYSDQEQTANGIGGYNGNYSVKWNYNGAPDCQYTCVVESNTQDTRVFNAGGETKSNSPTTKREYLVCYQNNGSWKCPVKSGQTIIQQCTCLNQGNMAIATMQALINAARDIICSKE